MASSRTLFFQLGRVVSSVQRRVAVAGRDDALDEAVRLGDLLGRGLVDLAIERQDAAEGAERIALVGLLEGRRPAVAPTAAPQGLLCLMTTAAGSANSRTRPRRAIEVEDVVVGQLLAVQHLGRGHAGVRERPAST